MEENLITISQTNTWEITRIEDGDTTESTHTLRTKFDFVTANFPQFAGMTFEQVEQNIADNTDGGLYMEGVDRYDVIESTVKA
jgi:hypothetical protein